MDSPLAEILSEIRERGFIPFDRFVELSLYGEKGYYTSKRLSLRPGEDFFTAPELSSLFGKVLSFYVGKLKDEFKLPLNLVEIGAGKGFLAKDLLTFLKPKTYFVVEKREEVPFLKGKVKWLKSLKELTGFKGFIVANELFDAFPFKRVVRKGGELFEVVVVEEKGELKEELRPFDGDIKVLEEGEYPLFLGWKELLREVYLKLKEGFFIVFDYGGSFKEVASKRSFRAFREGRLVEDYLKEVGKTDLTACVDFDRLKALSEEVGFRVFEYKHLSSFLLENGIERFASFKELPSVLTLLVDMGRKFKVLVLFKEKGQDLSEKA
ncbi:SAM-dependent methyltransferase [Thermovibrio sp.]